MGAFQFLQAADDTAEKPIGTFLRSSVVPLAEPSVSAYGASGEVKLTFALPAQAISYPLDVHGDPTALQYAWVRVGDTALATAGQPLTGDKVFAPPSAGFFRLALLKSGQRRIVDGLTLAVLVPFSEKERGVLRGYRIGTYLAERVRGKTPPPEGFLEIRPADVDLPITKHLHVGDFLNHDQQGVWPSYAAVNPKLLDKLATRRWPTSTSTCIPDSALPSTTAGFGARRATVSTSTATRPMSQSTPTATARSPRSTAGW